MLTRFNQQVHLLPTTHCFVISRCYVSVNHLVAEHLLRYDKKPIFGRATSKYSNCLGAVVRHAALSSLVLDRNQVKEHTINLLSSTRHTHFDILKKGSSSE